MSSWVFGRGSRRDCGGGFAATIDIKEALCRMSLPSRGFSDVRVSTLRFDPRTYGGVMGVLQLYPNGTIAPVTSITINSYDVSGGITVGNLSVLNNATIGGTLIANNIQSTPSSNLTIFSNNNIIIQPPPASTSNYLGILGRTNIVGPVRIAGTATRDPNNTFELWDTVDGHIMYDPAGYFGRWDVSNNRLVWYADSSGKGRFDSNLFANINGIFDLSPSDAFRAYDNSQNYVYYSAVNGQMGRIKAPTGYGKEWYIDNLGNAYFDSLNILDATSAGVSITSPTTVWGTGATSNSFLTVYVGPTPYRVPLFAVP